MGVLPDIWEDLLEDTSFGLFAIHCNLEDHALAYTLNGACGIRLERTRRDLEFMGPVWYPVFGWKDDACQRNWTVVRNSGYGNPETISGGLFPGESGQRRHYLIPEKREVDYFLKLEGEDPELRVLERLRAAPGVITAYRLEVSELKSKQNLIF